MLRPRSVPHDSQTPSPMSRVQVIGFAAISNPNIGSNPAYFIHASGTMPEMQESVFLLAMAESRKRRLVGN